MNTTKKISYISAIGANGLIFSTSFGKVVDISTLKQGMKVTNLYDEEVILFNIFDDDYYLSRNGLKDCKELDNFEDIQEKIIKLIKMMYSAPIVEFTAKNKQGVSNYQSFISFLNEALDTPVKLRKTKWDIKKYQKLYNEISFQVTKLSKKNEHLIQLFEGLAVCFNGLLFKNKIINASKGGKFPQFEEDGSISEFTIQNTLHNIEMLAVYISKKNQTSSHSENEMKEILDGIIM